MFTASQEKEVLPSEGGQEKKTRNRSGESNHVWCVSCEEENAKPRHAILKEKDTEERQM